MEKIETPECCEHCFHLLDWTIVLKQGLIDKDILHIPGPMCGYPTNDHPNIDMRTLERCPFEKEYSWRHLSEEK